MNWIGSLATVLPLLIGSALWLGTRVQYYADSRVLNHIIADDERRAALALEASLIAQLHEDVKRTIATDEAWLAAHPDPKK